MKVKTLCLIFLICRVELSFEYKKEFGSIFHYQNNELVQKLIHTFDNSFKNSSSVGKARHLENPLSDFLAINNQSNYADVHQAALTILKLQETYRFKAADLMHGKFNNIKLDIELSAADCFLIGKAAYLKGYHSLAVEWLYEAMSYSNESEELLDYLTFSLNELGRLAEALEFNNKLLQLNARSKVALLRKRKYVNSMEAKKNGSLQLLRKSG